MTSVRVTPVDCSRGPIEVAAHVLIERRLGTDASDRTDCGGSVAGSQFDGCWTSCDDGSVFVDFDLDSAQPTEIESVNGDGETVSVNYAARYASDSDGTITEAETLVLARSARTEPWRIVRVETSDTSTAQDVALVDIQDFFVALRNGDYIAAAALIAPAPSMEGRDDLGRLADEGFLTGTSAEEIAAALALWCDSGAACDAIPSVEIEVTADHSIRAIATYQLSSGTFETTFLIDENGIVGLPIKAG